MTDTNTSPVRQATKAAAAEGGKISCIILNYNDAGTTIQLVRRIRPYDCLDSIVVVDNCSTDDSWEQIEKLASGKVHVMRTSGNGGYGSGNQAGIDYAASRLSADYVLIANPDTVFTCRCVEAVKAALDGTPDAALASALVRSPDGRELFSCWRLLPLYQDLLDTGLVTRRLFKHWLNYPDAYIHGGGPCLVDAVPGSFFMARLSCFPDHKLFDERMFLYYEEKALACLLKERGLKTVLVTDVSYIHAHSVSIDRTVKRIADKQKLLHKSKLYYYQRYLKAGPVDMLLAQAFLGLVLWEVRFLTGILRMRW